VNEYQFSDVNFVLSHQYSWAVGVDHEVALSKGPSELAVMAAQIAALRKFRQKK
jgi:hypothetical protein